MRTWEECVDFHGHACPGLAIGYRASLEAAKLLDLTFPKDEDLVCVTENDACGVDGIQRMLGCSIGKGNLILRLRGKQAFSFYNRKTGKSVRLVLNELPEMERQARQEYIKNGDNIFTVKETTFVLPERARIMKNETCSKCGESTMESMIRLEDGKPVCLDCYHSYSRIF